MGELKVSKAINEFIAANRPAIVPLTLEEVKKLAVKAGVQVREEGDIVYLDEVRIPRTWFPMSIRWSDPSQWWHTLTRKGVEYHPYLQNAATLKTLVHAAGIKKIRVPFPEPTVVLETPDWVPGIFAASEHTSARTIRPGGVLYFRSEARRLYAKFVRHQAKKLGFTPEEAASILQ